MRRSTDNPEPAKQWPASTGAVSLVLVIALVSAAGFLFPDALDYQRTAVLAERQWWRLLSAHAVHLNAWHLLMNLAGLTLVLLLLHDAGSTRAWYVAFIGLALLISAALAIREPQLARYAGASGVIHGLVAYGALLRFRAHRTESLVLLIGLALKIGWEAYAGPSTATESLIGAPVISQAHLYGAIAGCAIAAIHAAFVRFRRA